MRNFKFCVSPEFEELAHFAKIYEKKKGDKDASTEESKQKAPDAVTGSAVTPQGPSQRREEAPTLRHQTLNGEERPENERNGEKEKEADPRGVIGGKQEQRSHRRKIEIQDEEVDDVDEDNSPVPKRRRVPATKFGVERAGEDSEVNRIGEFPKCPVAGCDLKFTESLEKHMKIHPRQSPCRVCLYRCSQRSNLRVHYLIHTGEKPFPCDTCGKSFNRPQILRKHQETHLGVKPIKCRTCKCSFADSSSLERHSLLFHSGDGDQEKADAK